MKKYYDLRPDSADDIVSYWNFKDREKLKVNANYLLGVQCRKKIGVIKDYLTVDNKLKEYIFATQLLFNKINQKIDKII